VFRKTGHAHDPPATSFERDLNEVSGPDGAVGLGARPVDLDFAAIAGPGRRASGPEEAGHVEPGIQTLALRRGVQPFSPRIRSISGTIIRRAARL